MSRAQEVPRQNIGVAFRVKTLAANVLASRSGEVTTDIGDSSSFNRDQDWCGCGKPWRRCTSMRVTEKPQADRYARRERDKAETKKADMARRWSTIAARPWI
jgi:hypothetical protein